jgi:antitoxin ParD1/3/4
MSNTKRLSVELTPELSSVVQEAVASGEFSSPNDVLLSALAEWQSNRLIHEWGDEEVGALWDEGIASGPSIEGEAAFSLILEQFQSRKA